MVREGERRKQHASGEGQMKLTSASTGNLRCINRQFTGQLFGGPKVFLQGSAPRPNVPGNLSGTYVHPCPA